MTIYVFSRFREVWISLNKHAISERGCHFFFVQQYCVIYISFSLKYEFIAFEKQIKELKP